MTTWYMLSALGWMGWIWSTRYLFHAYSECCDCSRCMSASWVPSLGVFTGIASLVVLMFAAVILREDTRWLAFVNTLPPWFTLMENHEGFIFWSKRGWMLRWIRPWFYDYGTGSR